MKGMKKFLAIALALVLVLSVLPMPAMAEGTGTTVYLLPNGNWTQGNAWFAAYYFGSGDGWVKLTGPDANGYYKGTIPAGYSGLVFARMNPASSALSWDSKWDQTADLATPITNNVYFAVNEGDWNNATGTWTSTPKTSSYTVAGSSDLCGTMWNPADFSNDLELKDGLWTKTYTAVPAGTHEFKVVKDHAWGSEWPATNYVLELTKTSDVVITFNRATGEVKATVVTPVTGVTLDQTAAGMMVGDSLTLNATVTPADATDKSVTWSSSNETVATVSGGTVTAKAAGTATITATAGGFSATCAVTVSAPVASVTIGGVTTNYSSLQKALNAVKLCTAADNAVVKVLSDVTVDGAQEVESGVFTLDLGTATITSPYSVALMFSGGTVEIIGNGTVTGSMAISLSSSANVTISGGTFESNSGTAIMSSGNLTVNGGTVRGAEGSWNQGISATGGCLTVNGGTISGGEAGLYLFGTQVSITGGNISGGSMAVSHNDSQYSSGTISISGGSFEGPVEMFDGCWGSIGRLPVMTGGSFPGGLVTDSRSGAFPVNDLLAEGYCFWQDGKMLTVADDVTSIEGAVVVKPVCKHNNGAYTVEGSTVSFECADCGLSAEAKLVAPEDCSYNAEEKVVAVESTFAAAQLPEITYEGDRKNVGTFAAKLTFAEGIEAELSVTITPAKLTIESIEVEDKVYDGTKNAVVKNVDVSGIFDGDDVRVDATGTFLNKNVGTDKVVNVVCTVGGTHGGNYTIDNRTAAANITPAVITVTAVSAADKTYDGKTDATVTSINITGVVTGDDVVVTGEGQFEDKNVGENKKVTVTFTLSGADAGNYQLAETTGSTTASITKAKDPSSPATGDNSNVMLWTAMMILSITGAAALVIGKKRYI